MKLKNLSRPEIYLALLHFPVLNKNAKVIASAVTNLDLHDMARVAKTYNVRMFYVVTPLKDQQQLVEEIAGHWTRGYGGEYNPARREALRLIRVKNSMQEVIEDIAAENKNPPQVIVTSARSGARRITYHHMRTLIKDGRSYVLTFGTAWGLAEEFMEKADYILEPVQAHSDYNHLAVRSAASIVLDRLLGDWNTETEG